MALLFNGVLAARDAGLLLSTSNFNKISVSDCTANAIKIDDGLKSIKVNAGGETTETDIVPNKNNLPLIVRASDWGTNTQFFASFNGDLEGGPLAFYGDEITSIMLRRTSNRSNFTIWEDLAIIDKIDEIDDLNFEKFVGDKTVESGVFYRYAIQPISDQRRGSLYKSEPVSIIYEDIYLVGEGGRQLRIRYSPTISTMKTNIRDARIETIGSKYPFIIRSGNVAYREFPLTGTITHFMDKKEDFVDRSEIFIEDEFLHMQKQDTTIEYESLYRKYDINDYNNTTLEREFRDKVIEFLQDGKPKLFKSPTEGSMLIRILDVSFTPNPILGRMIGDFSCNAVEIDEVTLDNLEKYKIINER